MEAHEMTTETVEKELHALAVAQRDAWGVPDFRWEMYPFAVPGSCTYVTPDGTRPACIIGQWLHSHGVPLGEMAALEGGAVSMVVPTLLGDVRPEVLKLLAEVQIRQDAGESWLSAIGYAAGHPSGHG